MRLAIGGLPGSGTTTLARLLSERLGIPVVSSGELFREMAKERGLSLSQFGELCERTPEMDREIDERMRSVSLSMENGIFEARLAAHFAVADIKIWLKAPAEVRAMRVARREGIEAERALSVMLEREKSEHTRYMKYYGIDLHDLSPYDVVLDSHTFNPEQLAEIVQCCIAQLSSGR